MVLAFVALVAAGCAGSTQPAIEVNGAGVDRAEFNDVMEYLAPPIDESGQPSNQLGARFVPDAPVLHKDARTTAVGILVENLLHEEEIARLGVEFTAEDEAIAIQEVDVLLNGPSLNLRPSAEEFLLEALLLRISLSRTLGPQYNERMNELILEADVRVDPRYGTWVQGNVFGPGEALPG